MSSNDYIVITGSHNLDDDDGDKDVHEEKDESSRRALEGQGIFLDEHGISQETSASHAEFSQELNDLDGIEILSNDDESDVGL